MAMLRLPANLVESVRADVSSERRKWVAALPDVVEHRVARWSLELGEPYQPGGQSAWVAPARDPAGRDLVLKVGWRHEEAADEAAGLRAGAGQGAVLVHDSYVWASTSALLLERCRPGTTLDVSLPEPEQDVVVANLLRQLWSASPDEFPFRSLQAMCDAWADQFWERLSADPGVLDPGLARAGMELFTSLPGTADRGVLLCTDLHAGNVLAAQRQPWLVIDPKPYVGDPTYDALQHLLNCIERLTVDPPGLIRRMADLLELDEARLRLWVFARCVQESIDQPRLRGLASALAPA